MTLRPYPVMKLLLVLIKSAYSDNYQVRFASNYKRIWYLMVPHHYDHIPDMNKNSQYLVNDNHENKFMMFVYSCNYLNLDEW